MEKLIAKYFDLFVSTLWKLGIHGKITAFLLIFFIFTLFFPKVREGIRIYVFEIINGTRKLFKLKYKTIDLNRLPIFYMKSIYESNIEKIEFPEDPDKTWIFRTVLRKLVDVAISELKLLVEDYEKIKKDFTKETFIIMLKERLNISVKLLEESIRKEVIDKYGLRDGEIIFNCIYHGSCDKGNCGNGRGFKHYNDKNVEFILNGLDSMLYMNNITFDFIIAQYVNFVTSVIGLAIANLFSEFYNFNGTLKSIVENGKHS